MSFFLLLDLDYLRDLLQEGTNKNFSNCSAYDELRDTIKVWNVYTAHALIDHTHNPLWSVVLTDQLIESYTTQTVVGLNPALYMYMYLQ